MTLGSGGDWGKTGDRSPSLKRQLSLGAGPQPWSSWVRCRKIFPVFKRRQKQSFKMRFPNFRTLTMNSRFLKQCMGQTTPVCRLSPAPRAVVCDPSSFR